MFGLTLAQAALTGLLAAGHSLDEARERLEISRNTARWTLKQVFLRTGTSRQSELVRLVQSVPGQTGTDDPEDDDEIAQLRLNRPRSRR